MTTEPAKDSSRPPLPGSPGMPPVSVPLSGSPGVPISHYVASSEQRPSLAKDFAAWVLGLLVAGLALVMAAVMLRTAATGPFAADRGLGETISELFSNERGHDLLPRYFRTFFRFGLVWVGGLCVGGGLGVAIGQSRWSRRLFDPLVNIMRFVVPVSLGGIIAFSFGPSSFALLFAAFSIPVWFVADAVARLAEDSKRTGQAVLYREKVGVVRTSMLLALLSTVGVGVLTDREGLGGLIASAGFRFDLDLVLAVSVILAVTAFGLDSLVRLIAAQIEPQSS